MTLKFSTLVRNAELDAIETTIGTFPEVDIYTGGSPANLSDAATGLNLVKIFLPSDWMNAANLGSKTKTGTWSGSAIDTGTASYFRMYTSGSVASIQGTVSGSAGGADMILDNVSISVAQTVTINTFTLNAGNS